MKKLLALVLLLLLSTPALAAGEDVILISDRAGLEAIADNPSGHYKLVADIDLSEAPWQPIAFSGTLDGDTHSIYNLTIREPDPQTAISVDGNGKEYDTAFAALFSRASNARIENLYLLGVDVAVTTEENAFAAGLVGWGENVSITGCNVSGRVSLEAENWMCGVGGLIGFGYGTVTDSATDVTLTIVNTNEEILCEEFMGAVLATGYVDVDGCDVQMEGFASIHGYVHNGGVIGMYYVHTEDQNHQGYVNNCSVDATIHFFENNADRRAYCAPVIGEQLYWTLEQNGNDVINFVNDETFDYTTILLPEPCADPMYTEAVTEPNPDGFGYTTFTCQSCGYQYTGDYTAEKELAPVVSFSASSAGQEVLQEEERAVPVWLVIVLAVAVVVLIVIVVIILAARRRAKKTYYRKRR